MKKPPPGSETAVRQGCTCPSTANNYGKGVSYQDRVIWYIDHNCPLHGSRPKLAIPTHKILALAESLSSRKIAEQVGVSHTTICNILKKEGLRAPIRPKVICAYCGKEFRKYRSEINRRKKVFCCRDHYRLWMMTNHS